MEVVKEYQKKGNLKKKQVSMTFLGTIWKIRLKIAYIVYQIWKERTPKKRNFLVKFSKKCPKNGFETCFFFKICLRRKFLSQNRNRVFLVI